jgi:hypothetical protein
MNVRIWDPETDIQTESADAKGCGDQRFVRSGVTTSDAVVVEYYV